MSDFRNRVVEAMARKMCAAARPSVDPDDLTPAPRGIMGLVPKWTMYQHLASAALTALLSELDAAGFGVKPLVATEGMAGVGADELPTQFSELGDEDSAREIYIAMLAAAPDPFKEPAK